MCDHIIFSAIEPVTAMHGDYIHIFLELALNHIIEGYILLRIRAPTVAITSTLTVASYSKLLSQQISAVISLLTMHLITRNLDYSRLARPSLHQTGPLLGCSTIGHPLWAWSRTQSGSQACPGQCSAQSSWTSGTRITARQ